MILTTVKVSNNCDKVYCDDCGYPFDDGDEGYFDSDKEQWFCSKVCVKYSVQREIEAERMNREDEG